MTSLLPVYERDLVMVSGKGARLTDSAGNTYLDFAAGIGVNGLGYGNSKVVGAIKKQASRLIHSSNLYFTEPVIRLADELVKVSFPSRVFFTNSGTEGVEAAIKFARRIGNATGRTELVALEGSFHGRTMGALSITWREKYRAPFEPLVPGVRFCPWNDLAAAKAMIGPKTAGVFIEPVQGEGGIRVAPGDFLHGLADICREAGAVLVCDEVQCGLGRTGAMFAFQQAHIRPDIVTLAKPLGAGLPLGAVLLREELAGALHAGDHGSTFGGNPVAAAASLVVMDKLTSNGFLGKIEKKGKMLGDNLRAIQRKYPNQIRDVRGVGLMFGIEFSGPAAPIVAGLRARGILATKAGENVLRLLPPLVVKRSELRSFLVAFDDVLAKGVGMVVEGGGGGAVA
jgi:acetylornithine/N-succinyldiaminopimelate aminotransferase